MQRFKEPLVLQSPVRRRGFLELFNALETLPAESARWGERSLLGPQRWARILIVGTTKLLSLLPPRLAFVLLMAFDVLDLRGRRRVESAYRRHVASLLANNPAWQFSGPLARRSPARAAGLLIRIGALQEAYDVAMQNPRVLKSTDTVEHLVQTLFEIEEFGKAHRMLSTVTSPRGTVGNCHLAFLKAMLDVIHGNEADAVEAMTEACRDGRDYMRPHQNLASRPAQNYRPNPLDFACGPEGRLFDLCNFTGQRVTHVGRGDLGIELFSRALAAQSNLRLRLQPPISAELTLLLARLNAPRDQLRIIPEEWSTQIGHLGMLDILFRMRELGWWSGVALIVVRPGFVANAVFLRLFERFGHVVVVGETVSQSVGEELLSLQRWYGMNFNVFELPNGSVVPWQEAGALAISQWEEQDRGHPLRDEFDRVLWASPKVQDEFQGMLGSFGMKPDDWYVCLHVRDASHYGEVTGAGQTHRNAPIESYIDAIRFITSKGGWVIKLGGPKSPQLPPLERTFDYAVSDCRSELMDVCLIRHARMFIGTTSGLTNVAISFGIPSAIVNGITTDSQLWNSLVRFVPKPVRLTDGTMLTQAQLTSPPWRWRLFDAGVLSRSGAFPCNNTADEICAAVEEVEQVATNRLDETCKQDLLLQWQKHLAVPFHYGTSKINQYYLDKYENGFLAPL
ncbi:TIGR04372 family glycosyltransferase [Bradyrhizobium sp. SZCCHNPS1003]|uniref:TIGR04372 family glycosyltransferase n=1 Tax=Bradyrhizobium sp. SZCCHNPS1003 TaxID=3057330 RepID=UPI0028E48A82|nr:TIGR04372 family glycosyltransferase [Bradyrhizobium sp. SZCCHNPS1003]